MKEEFNNLAFVTLAEVEEGILRGGILITDTKGKPVEFRCTFPIRPNAVQRTLYGDRVCHNLKVLAVDRPYSIMKLWSPDKSHWRVFRTAIIHRELS